MMNNILKNTWIFLLSTAIASCTPPKEKTAAEIAQENIGIRKYYVEETAKILCKFPTVDFTLDKTTYNWVYWGLHNSSYIELNTTKTTVTDSVHRIYIDNLYNRSGVEIVALLNLQIDTIKEMTYDLMRTSECILPDWAKVKISK